MEKKITFRNMDSSQPMREHAEEYLEKVASLLPENEQPCVAELCLTSNPQHPHHKAELDLRTKNFNLHTHEEDTKMYLAIDKTIDKMVALLKREKNKLDDKHHKQVTEKSRFEAENYAKKIKTPK